MTSATAQSPRDVSSAIWLRWLCVLLSSTSGLAILVKVWGVGTLSGAALWLTLPCSIGLVALGLLAGLAGTGTGNRIEASFGRWRGDSVRLNEAMILGFVGGALGTIGYDVWRVPFQMVGQLPFYPIEAYGIWLAEARASSPFTDTLGWSYHTLNGITFGIMYALAMPRRHWLWGVVWAMILESLAICSPFLWIFNLAGNNLGIAVAYTGHLAYGVPLGLVVWKWDRVLAFVHRVRLTRWCIMPLVCLTIAAVIAAPFLAPSDLRTAPAVMRVDGIHLRPGWVRINRGESVAIVNPGKEAAPVWIRRSTQFSVAPGGQINVPFPHTGVYQVFVDTTTKINSWGYQEMTHSSFVLVEPVERLD